MDKYIRSIKFENFKCFKGPHTLNFSDLTLIVGRNNSGKSTIVEIIKYINKMFKEIPSKEKINVRDFYNIFGSRAHPDMETGRTSADIEFTCMKSSMLDNIDSSHELRIKFISATDIMTKDLERVSNYVFYKGGYDKFTEFAMVREQYKYISLVDYYEKPRQYREEIRNLARLEREKEAKSQDIKAQNEQPTDETLSMKIHWFKSEAFDIFMKTEDKLDREDYLHPDIFAMKDIYPGDIKCSEVRLAICELFSFQFLTQYNDEKSKKLKKYYSSIWDFASIEDDLDKTFGDVIDHCVSFFDESKSKEFIEDGSAMLDKLSFIKTTLKDFLGVQIYKAVHIDNMQDIYSYVMNEFNDDIEGVKYSADDVIFLSAFEGFERVFLNGKNYDFSNEINFLKIIQIDINTHFKEGILSWLSKFDIADDIRLLNISNVGFAIEVLNDSVWRNICDIGKGAQSIIKLLLAVHTKMHEISKINRLHNFRLLVTEEPELGLHPMWQSLLAEFFVECVSEGWQIIVETHSEYIIRRLQYHAAKNEKLSKKFLVNHVLYNHMIREIEFDSDGSLTDSFESGFLDETDKSVMELLALRGNRKN